MTRLLLRLHHPSIHEQLPFSAVAKVRWLGELDGTPPKRWWTAEQPIGVGGTEFADFELPDGGYFGVDIVRARGTLISEEYRVAAGERLEQIVHLPESPHEHLSWAHFAGIVPSKSEAAKETRENLASGAVATPTLTQVDLPEGESAWYHLTADAPSANPVTAHMDDDGRFVSWWLPQLSDQSRRSLEKWIKEPDNSAPPKPDVPPRWMAVRADRAIDLVSIPWAWWLAPGDSSGEFQLVHDRYDPCQSRGRTVVSVRDSRWFPLLEFLASGRLGSAGQIADQLLDEDTIINALEVKRKGPLLAVAGGIILIARTKTSESQFWDPWLDNLANWFPRIPDGKILLGCRRLQQAQNEDDRRAAFFHLTEGFLRGIPYMSASFRMLSTALAQLGNDQSDSEGLRRTVAAMAAQVDPDQPFTVIRT
jgi:hypothetical protein